MQNLYLVFLFEDSIEPMYRCRPHSDLFAAVSLWESSLGPSLSLPPASSLIPFRCFRHINSNALFNH